MADEFIFGAFTAPTPLAGVACRRGPDLRRRGDPDRLVTVTAGGPGATVVLTVSGLTFHEILVDGHFSID
jgi:hypothetical protein